jgi:hypothetical protein
MLRRQRRLPVTGKPQAMPNHSHTQQSDSLLIRNPISSLPGLQSKLSRPLYPPAENPWEVQSAPAAWQIEVAPLSRYVHDLNIPRSAMLALLHGKVKTREITI